MKLASLGATLSIALALALHQRNPWFLDDPWLWLGYVTLPLMVFFGLLGLLLRMPPALTYKPALATLVSVISVPLVPLIPKPQPTGEVKLLVYGMDAATFDLLDPWRPELPEISRLRAEGVEATLRAAEPLFSPLLWTTLASARPPEEHGIRGFRVHATDVRVARFWDIMAASGLKVGTWKWLVTWPPDRRTTFQVPAWLAPSPETWPADLSFVKEIELSRRMARKQVASRRALPTLAWEGLKHGLRFSTLVSAARLAALQQFHPDPLRDLYEGQRLRVWMDRDVFVYTLHQTSPEVVTFTDYATDAIPHRFWRYQEPERFPGTDPALVERWGDAILETYRQADAVLGELRDAVGPQARVVVLSDHGHQAMEGHGQGHNLSPRTERLLERVRAEVGPADLSRLGHKLVVELLGPDPAAERERLLGWLDGLRVERTGEPLFRAEEVPGRPGAVGLAVNDAKLSADALATDRLSAEPGGGEPLDRYLSASEAFSGDHHDRGIFLAAGPGIATGALPEMDQYDVTPTLLALVGLPASHEMMRGAVPPELWASDPPALPEGPHSYDHLVPSRELLGAPAGEEVNEEQLRALGYIE